MCDQLPAGVRGLLDRGAASGRLTHVERLSARPGRTVPWPDCVPAQVVSAFGEVGIPAPWAHQAAAADHARAGRSVILATGTASGKSVGYLAPALTAIAEGGTALYLAPTRALAADQFALVRRLGANVRAAVVDSDTPLSQRAWARKYATYLLTTPDMLSQSLLPRHSRWNGFLRRLAVVVVDECHGYNGVFGSHVAQVLRRLRRVAEHHRGRGVPPPVFVLASATISDPAECARLLTGLPVEAVTDDAAPRSALTFAMWEPPLSARAALRRSAVSETADMLADLVRDGVPTLAFIRSRRGVEAAAASARAKLTDAGI